MYSYDINDYIEPIIAKVSEIRGGLWWWEELSSPVRDNKMKMQTLG